MGDYSSSMHAADLAPTRVRDTFSATLDQRLFFQMERHRLLPAEPDIKHIAYLPPRWRHHASFWQDDLRFDIWINWDDCVRIEHDGQVILKMRPPAGEVFRAIEDRRKATGANR